jgi:hypothetical protein
MGTLISWKFKIRVDELNADDIKKYSQFAILHYDILFNRMPGL